jgi:nucleoside-diphosphate-sugar epimerase
VGDDYFWRVNVTDTLAFLERCHKAGIPRFVHCSTVGVFGNINHPPADEDSECHPDVAYEKTKLAGERAVREYAKAQNYKTTVIRPAWVYGPRCPRTEKLFRAIHKKRFFYVGDGQTLRHPIYISDMVASFEIAAEYDPDPGEIFIIAGPRAVTLEELASSIATCLGVNPPSIKLPQWFVKAGVMVLEKSAQISGRKAPFTQRSMKFYTNNTAFSTNKAEMRLGFRAGVSLEAGLSLTRNWLLEKGRI